MKRLWALLTTLTLLCGCSLLQFPPKPTDPQELRDRYADALLAHNYPEASHYLETIVSTGYGGSDDLLTLGDLLQVIGNTQGAEHYYAKAATTLQGEEKSHLVHRLAVLYILKLNRPEEARKLLPQLESSPVRKGDIEALFLIKNSQEREALALLNSLLARPLPKTLASEILFHAAIAYWQLGSHLNCSEMLYKALGLNPDPVLFSHEIKQLWDKLNKARAAGENS